MDLFTATDSETRSADLVSDNVAHLKALFPEAFAEGKIDFDVLRQLLGDAIDDGEEKYGLNWHGKGRPPASGTATGMSSPSRQGPDGTRARPATAGAD